MRASNVNGFSGAHGPPPKHNYNLPYSRYTDTTTKHAHQRTRENFATDWPVGRIAPLELVRFIPLPR